MSYLNTKPLVYGFERGVMAGEMEICFDYPSKVAALLMNDEVDLALIPVAAIPQLKEHYIVSDYCIAASGPVASVCLFSKVPLSEIKTVILDYQSRTSVALLKILLRDYWKINPVLFAAENEFRDEIKDTTAGLIIGDRALAERNNFPYIYDLATAWQEMTCLPFVFAAWVSNKKIPDSFLLKFNETVRDSLNFIDEIVAHTAFSSYDLAVYYKDNIDYLLDDDKRKGLQLFLQKIA